MIKITETPLNTLFDSNNESTKKNDALQILKEQSLAINKLKYPNLPDFARVCPKYEDKTSNGLTKCIIHFIQFNGGQAERINCTGRAINKQTTYQDVLGHCRTIGSIEYIKTTGTRGTADISATIKGRSVKIEVKIGKDRQSEAQKQYQVDIELSGGLYYIAKDFNSFYLWYLNTFKGDENGK